MWLVCEPLGNRDGPLGYSLLRGKSTLPAWPVVG
jgi:hypothetical protein